MFRRTKELGKFSPGDLRRLHALEINGKDFGTEVMLLIQARALGLPVVGGSDAHHWLQLGVRHTLRAHRMRSAWYPFSRRSKRA